MKINNLLLLIALTWCGSTLQAATADTLLLSGIWKFRTDPYNRGTTAGWFHRVFEDSSWENMAVPSNWDLYNEYSHYVGKAWYRRSIKIPDWTDKTLLLMFDGVYHDSRIWMNGKLLGSNDNGFLPFSFDVSDVAKRGGENEIVLCADNTKRLGAIWNWGGIRRDVKLVAVSPVYIRQQHITPLVDLKTKTAQVTVKLFVRNASPRVRQVQGSVRLRAGRLYSEVLPFSASIPANSEKEVFVGTSLPPAKVHLWSFDDPFLYSCSSVLKSESGSSNMQTDRFGIRKIEVDHKAYTFKLNGVPVRLMGFNLVPDDRTTGNTLPLWRIMEDVDLMKSLGCNMTRLTHQVMPREMYDYLDEKGILVFPEVSLWGTDQQVDERQHAPKDWLKRMVFTHFNHPCIVGWSVGNEIGHNPRVMSYVNTAIKEARQLDTSRLAVMVSHTADRTPDPIQFSDLGLVNKYGQDLANVTSKMHQNHPDKLLFYSEYGIGQFSEELDGDLDATTLLNSIRNRPYLMGASLWTFNDYRSNYEGTKEASENRPWGVVDVFRQKKNAYYSFQKEYCPVKSFSADRAAKGGCVLTIVPRAALDLPAYPLHGYKAAWTVRDSKGMVLEGGILALKDVAPGDKAFPLYFNPKKVKQAVALEVSLLSPLNYSVADTTIALATPEAPRVLHAFGARTLQNYAPEKSAFIRLIFEKVPFAGRYKLSYGTGQFEGEAYTDNKSYIDIKQLDYNKDYKLRISALNSLGESKAIEVGRVTTDSIPGPPFIRYDEAADGGFFIGYETAPDDYVLQVQYYARPGDREKADTLQSTNKGVLFVPGLKNQQSYYYRIRRLKQNKLEGAWSEERTIVPDGGTPPPAPVVQGVIRGDGHTLICIKPVKKATGYVVEYRPLSSQRWTTTYVNAAQVRFLPLADIRTGTKYEFRVAAKSAGGLSPFQSIRN